MQRIKHISIPQPCHQDWHQMTPVEQGRHCQSCCKTVVDLNAMSNKDVISYLSLHKNTCGHIDHSKLAALNYQLELENSSKFSLKGQFAAALFSMLFPAINVAAQNQQLTVQTASVCNTPTPAIHSPGKITLKGKITSADDGEPLMGVSIVVKGTSTGTQTGIDGAFKLKALNAADTIVISSVGYKPIEIPVGREAQNLAICLETAISKIADISVLGYAAKKQCSIGGYISALYRKVPFYLRWWYWLKHQVQHLFFPSTSI